MNDLAKRRAQRSQWQADDERQLQQALHVEVPEQLADRIMVNVAVAQKRSQFPAWMGIAAALLLTVGSYFGLQYQGPGVPLTAHEAMNHLFHEKAALQASVIPLSGVQLNERSESLGADWVKQLGSVVFAEDCRVFMRKSVHLIIATPEGKITLLYSFGNPLDDNAEQHFQQQGFYGRIYRTPSAQWALIAANPSALKHHSREINQLLASR